MATECIESVFSAWSRLGVNYVFAAAKQAQQPERVLIETARYAPKSTRLFAYTVQWLVRYHALVDEGVLRDLAKRFLDQETAPNLAVILEEAVRLGADSRLLAAIAWFHPVVPAKPYFEMDRNNAVACRWMEQLASPASRRWGRWVEPEAIRENRGVIAELPWILNHNPSLRARARTATGRLA